MKFQIKINFLNAFLVLVVVFYFVSSHLLEFSTPSSTARSRTGIKTAHHFEASPSDEYYYLKKHLNKVLQDCEEICDSEITGRHSLYFDFIQKNVNCPGIWTNEAIDKSMVDPEPPRTIPEFLRPYYTFNDQVLVKPYPTFFNQRYLEHNAAASDWNFEYVNNMVQQCKSRQLPGTYGIRETNELVKGLQRLPTLEGANVLVIGSEIPWVEACVIAEGAKHVTTIEYGSIKSLHPQISTFTPQTFRNNYDTFSEYFDIIVSYSSVEHSGLGRYGDELNPWGDRQAIARAWCATKPGGYMLLVVPTGDDMIEYNAHRVYGKVMYPHLVANWKQIWRSSTILEPNSWNHIVHIFQK